MGNLIKIKIKILISIIHVNNNNMTVLKYYKHILFDKLSDIVIII